MKESILVRYDRVRDRIEPVSGAGRMLRMAAQNGGFVKRQMVTLIDGGENARLPDRLWVDRSPPSVSSTLKLVRAVHRGELDWARRPYFLHPIGVMQLLPREASDEEKMLALLHGSLEHERLRASELLMRGYRGSLVRRLKLLTNGPAVRGYDAFLCKMKQIADSRDVICIRVKIADCSHNIFHASNNYTEPLKILLDGLKACTTAAQQHEIAKSDAPGGCRRWPEVV